MEEIGQKLRSAREALGITLEQAEDETNIRRKYLQALEAANEADIPGEVYLKGFLRTYGNYVGLDGTELVEAYKDVKRDRQNGAALDERGDEWALAGAARQERGDERALARAARQERGAGASAAPASGEPPGAASGQGVAPVQRPRPTPAPRPVREPRPARERPRRPTQRPGGLNRRSGVRPGVKLLLFAVVLLAGVGYLGWLIFRQVGPASAPPPPTPPGQTEAPGPSPKPPEPAPTPPAPKVTMTRGTGRDVTFTVAAEEIQVKLEPGSDPVWLRAEVDGENVYEATTSKPVDLAGREIRILAGHMDGVSLTVNGQRFDKPLDAGTYNLIFTAGAEAQ